MKRIFCQEHLAEECVHFLTRLSVPKAMTLEEIAVEAKGNCTLRRVHAVILLILWDADCIKLSR